MPVDFFTVPCANPAGNCTRNPIGCLDAIPNQQFGITDENGEDCIPARVDTSNPAVWDLTVTNNSGVTVIFKAVDWCIPIYRTGTYDLDNDKRTANQFSSDSDGNGLIKRCEGFLLYDDKILFIEIKRRKNNAKEWIEDARMKFEETILSFREHHPDLAQKIIKPILVNRNSYYSAQCEIIQKKKLKEKIGVEFIRQNSICI